LFSKSVSVSVQSGTHRTCRWIGAGSLATSLGIDVIAEFQTLTNAFEFPRHSALDALNFFGQTSSPLPFKRNQFGGAIGRPIKKDKMSSLNDEGLRQSQDRTYQGHRSRRRRAQRTRWPSPPGSSFPRRAIASHYYQRRL
jgi:hypothetical protein